MATSKNISLKEIKDFQDTVLSFYRDNARDLPWRKISDDGIINPYKILVSEIMLQQTQVNRVLIKFDEFMKKFPTIESLASASFVDVLGVWSGLGYNKRAKFLYDFAKQTVGNEFPNSVASLESYKGIGKNTASAILVYAFDKRDVFIETNIRTVMLHHFFANAENVTDKDILEIVKQTLPNGSVREWYWGLMDYGTYLKRSGYSHISRAKSYKRQSTFRGSLRELRANILKHILQNSSVSMEQIKSYSNDERCEKALLSLVDDGLITEKRGKYTIS